MDRTEITEDNYNRLAASMLEKNDDMAYEEAIKKLESFMLNLICGEEIKTSLSLQAALLTAVNTGKRAFLGGVYVLLPQATACLLNWGNEKSLNEIIIELGGNLVENISKEASFSLMFGLQANIDENQLQLICNSWQGGICHGKDAPVLERSEEMPLGGIAAASIAVGTAFIRVSGINISAGDKTTGISLWKPGSNWLDTMAIGHPVSFLPKKYWLLGLGHLGQAYIWTIGLLPYKIHEETTIILQDFDKIVEANWSSGLLCEKQDVRKFKTRVCADWLEQRGFDTVIVERKFDENTKRVDDDPHLALCGFDSAKSRTLLENAGFHLIVEAALGSSLNDFDEIALHTFPNSSKTAKEIWTVDERVGKTKKNVLKQFSHLEKEDCGIIAQNIAGKAISSSFVGALAGSLVIAETIKALHVGFKYDMVVTQIRDIKNTVGISHKDGIYNYSELRNDGYLEL